MFRRMRQRLMNAGFWVISVAWLIGAMFIATEVFGVEARRGNLRVVLWIFLAPFAVLVVGEELVHRIKNGPQKQGRHARWDDLGPKGPV